MTNIEKKGKTSKPIGKQNRKRRILLYMFGRNG